MYTNETTHYAIPLPTGSDLTTPMDYNEAAQRIDTDLFGAKTDSDSALQKANQLQQDLSTTNDNVTDITGRVTALEGTVGTQGEAITRHEIAINDVRQDAEDMIVAKELTQAQMNSSTEALAVGTYFRYNNVLYRVTQAISVGDTIVPNTNCLATNIGEELTQVNTSLTSEVSSINNILADLETSYNFAEILASSAGGGSAITLSKNIKDYAMVRFENSNYGLTEVALYDSQTTIRLSTLSMSGSILVLCVAEFTISSDGKTLTPNYQVQVNVESTGVTLFSTSATYTWNVIGLKQNESI